MDGTSDEDGNPGADVSLARASLAAPDKFGGLSCGL
jgi:hypothetical protein